MQTLETGNILGRRYEIQEPFLKCRFSTLHHGMDYQSRTPVVLRLLMLPSDVTPDVRQQIVDQFLREAQVLKRLVHRNLPRVLDLLHEGDALVTIMEPFEGRPLDYIVEHMSVHPGQKLLARWMDQITAALDYLHSQVPPVVYRDLTPHSVILTGNAVIKLVDFGLARMVDHVSQATALRQRGAAEYAPPEQLTAGVRSEPRADLYALGATFYRLATGQPPPGAWDRLYSKVPWPDIGAANPQLSPAFCELIERLAAVEPGQRPQSAREVREALAALTGEAAVPPVAPAPQPMAAPTAEPPVSAPPAEPPLSAPPAGPAPGAPSGPEAAEAEKPANGDAAGAWGFLRKLVAKPGSRKDGTVSSTPSGTPDNSGFDYADLNTIQLDPAISQLLPESIASRIGGICIGRDGNILTIAVKQPEVYIYDHVSYATRGAYKVTLKRADAEAVDLAQEYTYRRSARAEDVTWLEWLEKKRFHQQDLSIIQTEEQQRLLMSEDVVRGPAVEMVDRMIKEAISLGASDIHIETYEKDVVLRYRIDGILHVMEAWPRPQAAAYIKRVKILANMDIAQELLPQGGRISVRVSDKEFDLRVSCVPVADGESIVMRLLSKGTFNLKLADLGFSEKNEAIFRRLVSQPHGMVLVSGPTGSGKSTTLYAALAEINRPDRKILTVEDPIEYKMAGVVQVQVNMAPKEEEKRLTFARALREFLRQDPDVILVGEIRDDETAAISVQAALTGHLLLSTIHTNDAIGIVTRLRDRRIETFLLSTTLLGGIAQRLIRRICTGCKVEVPVPPAMTRMFAQEGIAEPHMYVGKGCLKCHDTGYKGRVAIHEVLEINDELRDLIGAGANGGQLLAAAQRAGFKTLFQDGLEKVSEGVATLEEIKRVCMTVGDPQVDMA